MPSMKESLSLILRLLFTFGVMFELPLLLYLLGRAGILAPEMLRKGRKAAVLGVLLLAALLTPPDVASQVLIAVPLYILFEVGILLCAVGARRHKRRLAS
jgi:sec-independent protein translocase protein TatC